MEEDEELKKLEEEISNWKGKRESLQKEDFWKPKNIGYEKEEFTEEEMKMAVEQYVEEHLEGYQKYKIGEMEIEWCSEHYFACIRKSDNYICRGFFGEWKYEEEYESELFYLENQYRNRIRMPIVTKEYEIYFRLGKLDNRNKMRLQFEKFFRMKSIRVRKKKKEEIEQIDDTDWKETIDEMESQDLFEKIDDE
jgi:hypothetical protein